MPSELWNQGRVVGLSAYEVYVNQTLSEDPNAEVASEKQWLASSLAMGSSLLIKIRKGDLAGTNYDATNHVLTLPLPAKSNLYAANTIIGNLFVGSGRYDQYDNFANYVENYGPEFINANKNNDNITPESNISGAEKDYKTAREALKTHIKDYTKILDGVIIQSGTYVDSGIDNGSPAMVPKFIQKGNQSDQFIKLWFAQPIEQDFEILLTGFTIQSVVQGVVGTDNSVHVDNEMNPASSYWDGDFLGPGIIPWANKIVFSLPTSVINEYFTEKYDRQIINTYDGQNSDANSIQVDDNSVIDMRTVNPGEYYTREHQTSRVEVKINDSASLGSGLSVLTVYNRKDTYPPALFGTYVSENGINYLNPIDIVAPGSIKSFPNGNKETLADYQDTYPGTVAIATNDDGTISLLDSGRELVPASDLSHEPIKIGNSESVAQKVIAKSGNKTEVMLSLGSGGSDEQYQISDPPPKTKILTSDDDDIYWATLLTCLANDSRLNILGSDLKHFKSELKTTEIEKIEEKDGDGKITERTGYKARYNAPLEVYSLQVEQNRSGAQGAGPGTITAQSDIISFGGQIVTGARKDKDQEGNPVSDSSDRIVAESGNIVAESGNIVAESGNIVATGNIYADVDTAGEGGDVYAQGTFYTEANYIVFRSGSGGTRLYISSNEPTGEIPIGSIGIGWGFTSK